MSNSPTAADSAGAWGQVLTEARDIRNKQDARLASAQHQSQLIVAGFLAMTAVFVTAVSAAATYRPQTLDMSSIGGQPGLVVVVAFVATAVVNGAIWISTHAATRHWREVAEFEVLKDFLDSVDAQPQLERHLVNTHLNQFQHNELIVQMVQRRVGGQAALTLSLIYVMPVVWALT